MRGKDSQQSTMFSYVSPERRVPGDHPLRPIRAMVDVALKGLSRSFGHMYPDWGRPSIAPEKLLRALLLQLLYSIRSERLLMEQLEYNLLFRWFVGLNVDEPVWVPTVFSKNRDRLLAGEIAGKFFAQVLEQARASDLLSDEHFSVDGTLIEAWASQKGFQRKDENQAPPPDDPGNPTVNFHGEKRNNDTHQSTTDPEARLARKSLGHESKLAYCGNVLIENRNGLSSGHGTGDGERHGRARRCCCNGRADRRRETRDGECRQRLRHARVRAQNARAERDATRVAEYESSWWQRD
jgi:transposase